MKNKLTFYLIKGVSLALIFGAWLMTAKAQTVNLQLQNDYTIGNASSTPILAVGDVNNDGRPDLVTLNKNNLTSNGPIAVFLNNGAGGFAAPINITDNTGLSPNYIALGDYNKDGFLDMAIAGDGLSTGLNIRLGNGTGNFPTGTYINVGGGAFKILTADFNGDGNLDLVTEINQIPATDLKVLFGNGTGGFSAATSYAVLGHNDIEISDFNVDGKPDIAASGGSVVRVYLNNGAGVFTAAPDISSSVNRIVTADFNRDCIPDLAVSGSSTVGILLGNGTGGFTPQPAIAVTNQPSDIAVGDFNRDKKVDLVIRRTISSAAPNFTILPGNGAGGFGTAFELTLATAGQSTYSQRLAAIDANLDGKADIIIGRQGGFYLYDGNSALFTKTENDFDGDLRADLSVFRPSNGTWYLNRSTGGLATQQWGLGSDKLVPADYDGDGKTDIAVYRPGAPSIAAFYILNSSNNTFHTEQFGQNGDDSSVVSDWDGDGKADPAVFRDSAIGSQSYFFYRGSLNNPGGATTYLAWGTAGDKPVRGDFDGDGRADAGVFRPSNGTWYLLQSSNGQMRAQPWGVSTDRRVPADYDGDGKTDIAVVRPPNNDWYILNSATGTSSYRQWGANTDQLIPGDYNGDGKTEVATYRGAEGNWYIPQCADYRQSVQKFGASGDIAVPSSFIP